MQKSADALWKRSLTSLETRKDDEGAIAYLSDFSWMRGAEVRPGFEHYGATAYFDSRMTLIALDWSHGGVRVVKPLLAEERTTRCRNRPHGPRSYMNATRGDAASASAAEAKAAEEGTSKRQAALSLAAEEGRIIDDDDCDDDHMRAWRHGMWSWKGSVLVGITLKDHLLEDHLIMSNLGSTIIQESLPSEHPLRRFLKPFMYSFTNINYAAAVVLLANRGVLHRVTSLTWAGFEASTDQVLAGAVMLTVKERFAAAGLTDKDIDVSSPASKWRAGEKPRPEYSPFALWDDALSYDEVVEKLVLSMLKLLYPHDDPLRGATGGGDPLDDDPDARRLMEALQPFLHFIGGKGKEGSPLSTLSRFLRIFIVHVSAWHNHVGNVGEYRELEEGVGGGG